MAITVNASANFSQWESTSSTSQTMPTAITTKNFTVSAGKSFLAGDTIQMTATAAVIPTGIIGTVSSYSGTSLVVAPNNSVATNATLCGIYGRIWSKATVTNGTGAKTFTVSCTAAIAANLTAGLAIRIHSRVAPFTNFMVGTITSYTDTTGVLVVNVTAATGASAISDWVICQDGTFTAWNISPQWGDTLNINGTSILSITQTPLMPFKFINALTNGQLQITNSSTSTMLILAGSEPTGSNIPSNTGLRFEQNAIFSVIGGWITLGTATGAANESFAIPAGVDYCQYFEVETGVGTGIYEPWKVAPLEYSDVCQNVMVVKKTDIAANAGEASKWFFFKKSTQSIEVADGSTNGAVLTAGVRVRMPNIHLTCEPCSPNILIAGPQDSAITGSIATGNGVKSFTVATGFSYVNLDSALLYAPGQLGVYMTGTVTSYVSGTGAMTFTVTGSQGTYTGTGWVLLDQRSNLTVADWSANSSTTTTNGRTYVNGDLIASSGRTNGVFSGVTRNSIKEPGITNVIVPGQRLWYHGDAPGSGGGAPRRWQIDCAPSGTVYLENVSTHLLSLDLSDYSSFIALRCGIEHPYLRSTLGTTTINRMHSASVSTTKQYHGLRATALIGSTYLKNILTWTTAPDPSGNATACFTLSNIPSLTAWDNIQIYNVNRQRGFTVGSIDGVTPVPGLVPSNTTIVGGLFFSGMVNQEWEGFYVANKCNGNVGEVGEGGTQHVQLTRCSNIVLRKWRGLGGMKLLNNQLTTGDQFSFNIYLHDGDFSTNSNATSMTGMMANSGASNVIFANWNMGATASSFSGSLNRSGSGLVEKNVTFRRILTSTIGTYADNAGIPYSNGLQLEMVTAVCSYFRSAPTTNLPCPSYKDAAGFYTLVDPGAATGRLMVGDFAGSATLPLYSFTGTAYANNAGLIVAEGSGDEAIISAPFAIRGITAFKNLDPLIQDGRNTLTTSGTSVTVATGSQTFTVGSGLAFTTGDTITVVNTADTRMAMAGTVTSYVSTTLIINVTAITGSGTAATWTFKSPYQAAQAAYSFRACQWGEDITSAAWQSLTGANLASFSITSDAVGINMQIRFTGVGALAGRYLQQVVIFTNNNASFKPSVTTFNVSVSNAVDGSTLAVYDTTSGSVLRGSAVVAGGTASIACPAELYGISTPTILKLWLYGYQFWSTTSSYYNANANSAALQFVDPNIVASRATALAYTGIAWSGSVLTITANHSPQEIYDWHAAYIEANKLDQFITGSPASLVIAGGLTLSNAIISGVTSTITLTAGTFIKIGTGDTNNVIFVGGVAKIKLLIPALVNGSRVLVKNASTVIDNSVVSGGMGYALTLTQGTNYAPGDTIRFIAFAAIGTTYYQPMVGSFSASSGTAVFPDAQRVWAEPTSRGLAWTDVTECATDYNAVAIDVVDPDNIGYKSRYAIFMTGALMESEGLLRWADIVTGATLIRWISSSSVLIDDAVGAVAVINTKPVSKLVCADDFALHWSDGVQRVDAVLGSSVIWINPLEVATAPTSVAETATAVINGLMDGQLAEVESGITFRQSQRALLADSAGERLTSGSLNTLHAAGIGSGQPPRISGSVDVSGNRTGITLSL